MDVKRDFKARGSYTADTDCYLGRDQTDLR